MLASSRRSFLRTTALAGSSLLLTGTRASGRVIGANDRLRIAVAGVHGRGQAHIAGWLSQPNVEIAYLIDPDAKVLAGALQALGEKTDGRFTTKGVADVREALEDKSLDAISI
ncbi:MAG: gfo/Idh/MocA family oxidoreductase, partial [Aureliella sp.]